MRRREFLGSAALGLLAASWPPWLRRAFADTSVVEPGSGIGVARDRARRNQRPLLALVIPSDDAQKWNRGSAFGQWLNYASDEQLAPLALCELACARLAELPPVTPGPTEPWMVLVDGDRAVRADAIVPDEPDTGMIRVAHKGEKLPDPVAIADRRIAVLSDCARFGLLRDEAAAAERASRADRRAARVHARPWSGNVTPELLVDALTRGDEARVAAADVVLGATATESFATPYRRASAIRRLAGVATLRWRRQPPPGSHWAKASVCGPVEIEDVPDEDRGAYGCGMGSIPPKSERFLYLLTVAKKKR